MGLKWWNNPARREKVIEYIYKGKFLHSLQKKLKKSINDKISVDK